MPFPKRSLHKRSLQRLIAAAVLTVLGAALAGCGGGGASSFDPSDLLDFMDTKKKLPGERKPVFPEGVPGLEQGVPRELYKDNVQREQQDAIAAEQQAATPPAAAEARPKQRAPKAARAPRRTSRPAAPPPPVEQSAPAPQPAPVPQQPAPPQQPAQTAPFPAPLPSGGFGR